MNTVELIILVASAFVSGAALTALGVLIEFSVRKRAPTRVTRAQIEPAPPPAPPEVTATPEIEPQTRLVPPAAAAAAPPSEVASLPQVSPAPEVASPPEAAALPEEATAVPLEAVPVAPEPLLPPPVTVSPPPEVLPAPVATPPLARFRLGLRRTREGFLSRLRSVMRGGAPIEEIYDGLEEALISADVGVDASTRLVAAVRGRLKGASTPDAIREALKGEISTTLSAVEREPADSGDAPLVVMLVGVNGVGKTTTVAKLAAQFKAERGSVLVAAADTFRAAAIEQLEVWCQRVEVDLIKQKPGSDPAAVAFDAVKAARARGAATVLIDTAGRLQTKVNLMEELKKIARVVGRELPGAPHETWLVLDATTGQNALSQAKLFADAVPLTGVVLAKLDSTAKGGVIIAIADRLKLPVRFVGIGEGLDDLRPFDGREFAEALFTEEATQGGSSYAA
ncbi:MAG TPA: signal recognition particle-docking protein FtsY [Candidatus Binataceae bacterium]|nr:signal recognition particle-docking protein FtsY [Candidatus Binataceae bacterium]